MTNAVDLTGNTDTPEADTEVVVEVNAADLKWILLEFGLLSIVSKMPDPPSMAVAVEMAKALEGVPGPKDNPAYEASLALAKIARLAYAPEEQPK